MGFAGNCDSLHTGNEAANTKRGTSGCVILLKLTQRLFDESVTSLQVAQLEERLQFLMRFPACFPDKTMAQARMIVHSAVSHV